MNKKKLSKYFIYCSSFYFLFFTNSAVALPVIDGSWVFMPHGGDERLFMDIVVDQKNNNIFYLATNLGIYKTTDKGKTWSKIFNGSARQIVIDPTNSNILYTGPGDKYAIYKSTDRGITWNMYRDGFTYGLIDLGSLVIATKKPNILFSGDFCDGKIFLSTDSGMQWRTIFDGKNYFGTTEKVYQHDIEVSSDGNVIYIIPSVKYYNTGRIVKSIDGGKNWSMIDSPFNGDVLSIAIDENNPSIIYVGSTCGELFLSLDGGKIWKKINLGTNGYCGMIEDIDLMPNKPEQIYIVMNNSVYQSSDYGATWSQLGSPVPVGDPPAGYSQGVVNNIAIDPVERNFVYALVCTDGLWQFSQRNVDIKSKILILVPQILLPSTKR